VDEKDGDDYYDDEDKFHEIEPENLRRGVDGHTDEINALNIPALDLNGRIDER
jgi:hypothetical protein